MEVNFDHLRITGAKAYNKLCKELNRHVDGEYIRDTGKPHDDVFVTGDIRDEMDALRDMLALLLSLESDAEHIKAIDYDLEVFAPEPE